MSLSLAHVSFGYSSRGSAPASLTLRDASVTIARGSITGILGPNGSGKTTLLKLMAGVLRPHQGEIALEGRPLDTWSRRALARRVALVPQETHPTFDFTVLEMVLMGRHPHLRTFQLEGPSDLAIARDALSATGITHLEDRLYSTLSGGEKQRVVIASALSQRPEILLLDEPTTSLDLAYQLEVTTVLERLNRARGVAIVVAAHDLNLAADLCDSLLLMRSGRVLAHGPTDEVLTERMVRDVFDVDAEIHVHHASGQRTVLPRRCRP
jgi:iron complex transport system ATP-binding protein